jgi:hypothetical protein
MKEVNSMQVDPFDLADVPTVAEYKEALLAARDAGALKRIDGRSLVHEMLRAHYAAQDRTVTAGELAASVNLANFRAANLKYGEFAKALCAHLGRAPTIKVAVLVRFSGGTSGLHPDQDEAIRWTMLPEVAQALEELGWVKQRSKPS